MEKEEKELLLHCCCAPCAGGCVERLLGEERHVAICYSNSNLADEEEYEKRLDSVRKLAEIYHLELIVDPYDHAAWREFVKGFEDEPERGKRCEKCFAFSLARTAEFAAERGMNFSTSLTVSPHKNSVVVFAAAGGNKSFEPIDFKKRDGFLKSRRLAVRYGFYLQNFCGCEFSRAAREAMQQKTAGPGEK